MADRPSSRVAAIDWMRGLVMVLMTVDHASEAFNAGRLFTDAAWFPQRSSLPLAQFFTRWITHLCAPTFVFLAGTSLALSVDKREGRGDPARAIDLHMAQRGLFIALLDPLWMSLGFNGGWSRIILQVLYAIGVSLMLMAALRRLPPTALVGLGVVMLCTIDFLVGRAFDHGGARGGAPPLAVTALVSGGRVGRVIVAYPVLPWLSIMMLGWALGQRLGRGLVRPARLLALAGVGALGVFAALRGLDGFGNAGLHRVDGSLVQWLHVSKYPPSVTFVSLELGLMALLLALLITLEARGKGGPALRALGVLGENPLFYYLLHVHLLTLASQVLGVHRRLGLGATYGAAAATTTLLYFGCRWYSAYKSTHKNLLTRWV